MFPYESYIRCVVLLRKWQVPVLFLILLLMMQSVISLWVLDMQLKKGRKEIKWSYLKSLPKEQLTLVKIATKLEEENNPYFQWKHSREFRFLGEWYDVVQSEQMGDTTYYYCFHDKKETVLYQKIQKTADNWLHTKEKSKHSKSLALYELFKQTYLSVQKPFILSPLPQMHRLYHADCHLPETTHIIHSPPPEMV